MNNQISDPEVISTISWVFWRKLTVVFNMRRGSLGESTPEQRMDCGYCLDRYVSESN